MARTNWMWFDSHIPSLLRRKDERMEDVRTEVHELSRQVAKLEGRSVEYDKRLATKEDVVNVRMEIGTEIGNVRLEIEKLRSEVSQLETRIVKLLFYLGAPLILGVISILGILIRQALVGE